MVKKIVAKKNNNNNEKKQKKLYIGNLDAIESQMQLQQEDFYMFTCIQKLKI